MRSSRSASRRGVPRDVSTAERVRGCSGKRCFDTWNDAAREAQMVRRHKDGHVEAYHCRYCNRFHVGSRT
jgi:aspartate carbamoyltransferase regulatory subunit